MAQRFIGRCGLGLGLTMRIDRLAILGPQDPPEQERFVTPCGLLALEIFLGLVVLLLTQRQAHEDVDGLFSLRGTGCGFVEIVREAFQA